MKKRFIVGIDLGTSNSALAVGETREDKSIDILPIPQLFSWQAVGEEETLPSVLYLPLDNEIDSSNARLPWDGDSQADVVVGRFAREQGTLVPDRLVTSAKSWLCNPHVDPEKPLLPWNSSLEDRKVSASQASRKYLEHLLSAFRHHMENLGEKSDLDSCEVVVTVPASFDEIARILTHDAVSAAGWGDVTLLEEQQAAFYHWIDQAGDDWRNHVSAGDIVLICDVGGGTADFSLVAISEQQGKLELERISVGDHILLGGDNMDLALAYTLKARLEKNNQKIDTWQFLSLTHSCRLGKEKLFADPSLAEFPISIPSRGSGLFAGMITTVMERGLLDSVILDGYFPKTDISDHPPRRRKVGLQEFGLEYEAEPAFSKHLASFLARSWQNAHSNQGLAELAARCGREKNSTRFLCPTAVLFNGGVFKAEPLRRRVLDLLKDWNSGEDTRELVGSHFDLAVARGAATYARSLASGQGIRIKAGTARSYYIGLESSMPAVPGMIPPFKAICVVPQGMEEGSKAALPEREFGLVTGEQVEFSFYSSSVRAGDAVGDIIENEDDVEETSSLEMTLPPLKEGSGALIPVRLHSIITEVGTLELWMCHEETGRQWKLEFNVRGE